MDILQKSRKWINTDQVRKHLTNSLILYVPTICVVDSEALFTVYIKLFDRGDLKYPSKFIILVTFVVYAAMQKLISAEFETKFLTKQLLIHIVSCSLQEYFTADIGGLCCRLS